MSHQARVVHLSNGWIRWAVRCPCGLSIRVHGGKDRAQEFADAHNGDEVRHG